jgi:transposase
LSKWHDISRQLIRIWVGKFEVKVFDDDVQAADLLEDYETKIAALEGWWADKRWRSNC